MKEIKTHTIFIDTKLDKNQNPSKFNVKLHNWFLRNNIKNNDGAKNNWYMSVKSLAMFNSFSNITKDINDKILLYVAKDDTKPELVLGVNNNDYDVFQYLIREGNPNVIDIQQDLNTFLVTYEIECVYNGYDSKYIFRNISSSTDKKKKYLKFVNSYDLMGFKEDKLYYLNNDTIKNFKSETNVNMMADRLLKFSIAGNSDFCIKNMNYCNHLSGIFSDCNMFHLQTVNVNAYDLIYYERSSDNLIPIELYKNNINDFQIIVQNNDNQDIEGLSHYIMVLEFTQVKTWDYNYKIYKLLRELYMWIAITISNRRWF